MLRMERTVYRRLKQNITPKELAVYFTPSKEESGWAKQCTLKLNARLNLLVNLKVFQYLGYFAPFEHIPTSIYHTYGKRRAEARTSICATRLTKPSTATEI
jgi:hypothetical protein